MSLAVCREHPFLPDSADSILYAFRRLRLFIQLYPVQLAQQLVVQSVPGNTVHITVLILVDMIRRYVNVHILSVAVCIYIDSADSFASCLTDPAV